MEGVELRPDVRPPSGSVPWPFDRVRDGQSDFLQDARKTLAAGKHLLAHAPTGIGKTAVALVAALDYALTADKLVLFLTSRQSHHRIAIETVRRIEAKGPRIPTIDLIAKHSMCLQEGAPSHGRAFQEFCDFKVKSRTCGFFTRDNSAVVARSSSGPCTCRSSSGRAARAACARIGSPWTRRRNRGWSSATTTTCSARSASDSFLGSDVLSRISSSSSTRRTTSRTGSAPISSATSRSWTC